MAKTVMVKNKTPSPIQITAEQILRESMEMQHGAGMRSSKQKFTDSHELSDYRLQKRKRFEDVIRRVRWNKVAWMKYAKWEESQKDFTRARSVWERAMKIFYWEPAMWVNYAETEMKNKFINHARNVWERAVYLLPRVDQIWLKYIHMEEMLGNVEEARSIFERWMTLQPDHQGWFSYIKFELRYNEIHRARSIFDRFVQCHPENSALIRYAFDYIPKTLADKELYEDNIVGKRRLEYENEVNKNPQNYDAWFDYIHLEESVGIKERIREIYERAIANVPPVEEKRYWARYIYLWINYALFEELDAQNVERTREVYKQCLNLIPHKKFSFAKIWLLAAKFEIRQSRLKAARSILDQAIEKAPKNKIFKKYIEIELYLGNIDGCRELYVNYLEWCPGNCCAWIKYAEMEKSLNETERARAIFQLATDQHALDMPELLWKAYIDFEISQCEYERARALYERLLERTKHLKVWISYAKFEASAVARDQEMSPEQKKECLQRARGVFERALDYSRTSVPELKEERAMLLEEWLNMESSFGVIGDVGLVPKKLKKRKLIETEDGPAGTINLKILEAAYNWKRQKISSF